MSGIFDSLAERSSLRKKKTELMHSAIRIFIYNSKYQYLN